MVCGLWSLVVSHNNHDVIMISLIFIAIVIHYAMYTDTASFSQQGQIGGSA